jgi:hypothetical protein
MKNSTVLMFVAVAGAAVVFLLYRQKQATDRASAQAAAAAQMAAQRPQAALPAQKGSALSVKTVTGKKPSKSKTAKMLGAFSSFAKKTAKVAVGAGVGYASGGVVRI